MTSKSRRVGIYTRISLDRDGNAPAPGRQLADCRAIVEGKGWTVAEVYTDRDESAYSTKAKRPQYRRMLDDLEAGTIDAVAVYRLDRLARRLTETNKVVARIDELGAVLLSVSEQLDTSTPIGRAIIGFQAAQSEQESANTAARVKRARADEIAQGKMPTGGRRCLGYDRSGDIIEHEAATLRQMVAWYLDGVSLRQIANRLNDAGVTTTTGGQWQTSVVRTLLHSPRAAGFRLATDGKSLVPGLWVPIIDPATWSALQEALTKAKRPAQRRNESAHVLTGLAHCALCGGKLTRILFTTSSGKKSPRLTCAKAPGTINCGRMAITQSAIDAEVTGRLLKHLERKPALPIIDTEPISAQLAEDRRALDDLTRARFITRQIDQPAFDTLSAELTGRIEAGERSLDHSLARGVALTTKALSADARSHTPAGRWEAADLAGKRSMLRSEIESVIVHPATKLGRRFDAERVEILWRS